MEHKARRIIFFLCCMWLFVSSTVIGYLQMTAPGGTWKIGSLLVNGGGLRYFTTLSNYLMGLCAFFALFQSWKRPVSREMTGWFFTSACAVGLTAVTVLGFLGPNAARSGAGFGSMFEDDMLFFHLLNPLVAAVGAIILPHRKLSFGFALWGLAPTVIYSGVYAFHVLTDRWTDFYGFTFGGNLRVVPYVIVAMYVVTVIIAAVLMLLHNVTVPDTPYFDTREPKT